MAHPSLTRISQNIGGIGNATIVPAANRPCPKDLDSSYFAFDTGPGNVLIDATVRLLSNRKSHYDKDGEAGSRGEGEIDQAAVEAFLSRAYFRMKPPKTTGREIFSDDLAREQVELLRWKNPSISDDGIIATITRMTSESIVRAYEEFVIPVVGKLDEVYICGGGAFNPNIMKWLRERLPQTMVERMEKGAYGLRADAKEAVLFAVLGFLGICGRQVAIAGFSENRQPALLGAVTPGENYRSIMKKVVEAEEFNSAGILGKIIIK
jgi:1,6-anhydro-N-acetylmuramate kinase